MNRRGVCYDVGRVMWGQDWRPEFSAEEARRELQIIKDDLHCNAVRICGQDPARLIAAGRHALDCGERVTTHLPGATLSNQAQARLRIRTGRICAFTSRPQYPSFDRSTHCPYRVVVMPAREAEAEPQGPRGSPPLSSRRAFSVALTCWLPGCWLATVCAVCRR